MNNEVKYRGGTAYKRVILWVAALLIAIPVCACGVLLCLNFSIIKANQKANEDINQMQVQIEEAHKQIEENKAALEELVKVEIIDKEPDITQWNLLLVNELHPLARDYEVKLDKVSGGRLVDERIIEDLETMMSAMRKEGMQPVVCSGYRSLRKQESLFEESVEENLRKGMTYEEAYYKTKTRQAVPGASEHHTGLAVDIVGKSHQSLNDAQANTKEAKWLAEHCMEYGFILRYPKDAMGITGRDYESWHFRYVGKEAANYIMKNNITLEEYVEKMREP